MRRIVLSLLLAFCCCAPAMALDWHLDATLGVNDDTNLESRIDWHVQYFYFEVEARQTDFHEASMALEQMAARGYFIRQRPVVAWDGGLQWRAAMWWKAFDSHGPAVNYTRVSDLDATWFAGWHFSIGNSD